MTRVEQADVAPAEPLHETAHVAGLLRRHEEVDMVVHEDIGMQAAVRCSQRFPEQLQIPEPVTVVEEAGQTVVASLDHV